MERNRNANAIVAGQRQNQQKPAQSQLEGARKLTLVKAKKGKRTTKGQEVQIVMSRLVTQMKPGPVYPMPYDSLRAYSLKRRWISSENIALGGNTFKIQDGHKQFLVVQTTGGVCCCFVDCWRIKRINVFTINYVDNATTVDIRPLTNDIDTNCFNDREAEYSCSSRSEAQPGHMEIVPARDTPLGSWHRTSTVNPTGQLFGLDVSYGGASSGNWATITMDIEFEFVLNTIGAPQGFLYTSLILVPGTMGGANLFSGGFQLLDCNVL